MKLPGTATEPEASYSSTVADKIRSGRRVSGGLILCVVKLLAGLVALALMLFVLVTFNRLEKRLANVESWQQTAAQDDRVAGMQDELATLRQQVAEYGKLIAGNRQTLTGLRQNDADTASVAQQVQTLKALTTGQDGLKSRIATLETQLATQSPVAVSAPKTTESASPLPKPALKPAVSALKGRKSTSARPHPKSTSPVVARASAVPFVLTGTERRGAQSLAAVAPKGYRSLSQIALIGEGETVAGWTLVRAGYGEATFRVNGRTVLVSAH
jgi:uncharacterized coiled-coil protein SlyX